jgi:adenylate cyclase
MKIRVKLKISPFQMGILVVVAACLIFNSFGAQKPDLLTSLDNRITDAMFRWRGPMKTTGSVVIVDIDEKSLKYAGQWPWPRNIVARLVQKINAAGPRVIAFDIVFPEADRTSPIQCVRTLKQVLKTQLPDAKQLADNEVLNHDIALGSAVANAPTVMGYVFQLTNDGLKVPEETPFPAGRLKIAPVTARISDLDIISAYRAVVNVSDVARGKSEGFFNVAPDPSGTVRKVPLLMGLDHIPYPSLALETFRVGQRQQELTIHIPPEKLTPPIDVLGLSVGSHFIPTDEKARIAVNFRGPANTFPYVSAADVLQDRHQTALENKYVLIGTSASGLFDLVATPFSNSYAGVEVHATVIDNMIAGDPFAHDIFTEIGLTYTLVAVGGILLILLLVYSGPLQGGLCGLAIVLAAVAGNYHFFFLENVLVGVTYPFLSLIAVFIVVTVFNYFYEGREKSFIRSAFGHYVSPQLVNQLILSPDKLSLKGEQKNLTVLFSDIRGFTTISEQMSSEQLGEFMNEYLTTMSHIIRAHDGTLDKFIGDAIMAIWGAPLDDEDHAAKAVRASMEMMDQLKVSQADFAARGLPVIEIGIGINTGIVSVGNFGSRERFDYTVMGDNVNLASRLEGLNKDYGPNIIISEFTKAALGERFFCRIVDKVQVKGKNKAVVIYEPLVEGAPDEALRREVDVFENAVRAYQAQQFEQAFEVIEALYRKNPLRLYGVYLHRMKKFRDAPPPPNWNGVERRSHQPEKLDIQ